MFKWRMWGAWLQYRCFCSRQESFTATSGLVFLLQENLGVAVMAEVPCVIINVQRSGPSTGHCEASPRRLMQSRWGPMEIMG